MKLIYKTLLALVITLSATFQIASAQTILFNENFTDENYDVTRTLPWEWINDAPVSPGSGGHYLQTAEPNNPGNSGNVYALTFTVSTLDFTNIELSWLERHLDGTQGNNSPDTRSIAYRTNSTSPFITITPIAQTTSDSWVEINTLLGSVVSNVEELELQIIIGRPRGSTRQFAIDDIILTGTFNEPIDPSPFPVEMFAFNGKAANGMVKLAWATATETNNEKFEVERSQDGSNFSLVGEVKGSGNSATKRNYNFTDNSPASGANYYRLRQVDTDGSTSFSSVVAMQVAGNMTMSVYPTLASSSVKINLQHTAGNATIQVTDITGKTVATVRNNTLQEVELPVQNFKSGMYFVRVTDGQNQQVQRFIKE